MRRLLMGMVASLLALALSSAGIVGAWAAGVRLPLVSGATNIKVARLDADFVDGVPTNRPVFVMLVGSDLRPGIGGSRGDALHLLAVNPKLRAGTIVNFPRDTCTQVPGRGLRRINEANSEGGPALTARVVASMTGAPVSYAMEVDFAGFQALVDGTGGVAVDVPFAMNDKDSGASFAPGRVAMSGERALAFARDRKDFGRGDIQRSWNQGYLVLAAIRGLEARYRSAARRFGLAALAVRHARLSGVGLGDLVRLGELASTVPAANIKNVTIPLQGSGCLAVAPAAAALFADLRDDGVLQRYPGGVPTLPDPRP